MRNAIGFVIILWALSHFLGTAFSAAATQSFKTWQVAAEIAEERLLQK